MVAPSPIGFEALHPAVQYHVVNSLRWPGLRPLQEAAVAPLLAAGVPLVLIVALFDHPGFDSDGFAVLGLPLHGNGGDFVAGEEPGGVCPPPSE